MGMWVFLGDPEERDDVQALAEEGQLNWGSADLFSSEPPRPGERGSLPSGLLKAGRSRAEPGLTCLAGLGGCSCPSGLSQAERVNKLCISGQEERQ